MAGLIAQPTPHKRVSVWWVVVLQWLGAATIAPCDGGRWLYYTLVFLGGFDIAACLVIHLVAEIRQDTSRGISIPTALTLLLNGLSRFQENGSQRDKVDAASRRIRNATGRRVYDVARRFPLLESRNSI